MGEAGSSALKALNALRNHPMKTYRKAIGWLYCESSVESVEDPCGSPTEGEEG